MTFSDLNIKQQHRLIDLFEDGKTEAEILAQLTADKDCPWTVFPRGLTPQALHGIYPELAPELKKWNEAEDAAPPDEESGDTEAPTPVETGGDWMPDPEHPGYALDPWGRPKVITAGKGRKLGYIIRLQKQWGRKRTKGGKYNPNGDPYFRAYYQMGGKKVPQLDLLIRRYRLERIRDGWK